MRLTESVATRSRSRSRAGRTSVDPLYPSSTNCRSAGTGTPSFSARSDMDPCSFLIVSIAGWMNRHQQSVIEYLMEENRVLREQIGRRRLRFDDNQRRRLAVKAKKLGRRLLS